MLAVKNCKMMYHAVVNPNLSVTRNFSDIRIPDFGETSLVFIGFVLLGLVSEVRLLVSC